MTHQFIGQELHREGQLQKSVLPLKKATIINPQNESAQLDLAKTLFELKKDKEALSCMKENLSSNPESSSFHELLVQIFEKKHRLGDFESFSNEIVDMIANPKSITSFYFASAKAWLDCGNSAQALLVCRKVIKNDPPMGDRWRILYGEVLQREGLYEEALLQFEQVKKRSRSNGDWDYLFLVEKYQEQARNSVLYMTYCLGGVHTAKAEFRKIVGRGTLLEAGLAGWNYLLMLCHIEDEIRINSCKKYEFEGYFPISDGEEWIRFYEQEIKTTQKILENRDLDEFTRKFNVKKLKALNVFLPILKERVDEEIFRAQWCW